MFFFLGDPLLTPVRRASLAKGPDSSLGEEHRVSCSEPIHMEEGKVEVKVQEEEVEDRERRRREQSEDRKENRQSLRRMTHGWDDARAVNEKKVTCEVYCLQLLRQTLTQHSKLCGKDEHTSYCSFQARIRLTRIHKASNHTLEHAP